MRLSNRVIENKIIILTGFGIVFAAAILFAIRQKSVSRQTAASKMQTAETTETSEVEEPSPGAGHSTLGLPLSLSRVGARGTEVC